MKCNMVFTLDRADALFKTMWCNADHLVNCILQAQFTMFMTIPNTCRLFTDGSHDCVHKHTQYLTLTLSQCTLAGPVYTRMPLEGHWLTQCTLGYHWATQLILAGYTGLPLEKLSWNRPTLECHWRNLVESAPHWYATGETLTFTAYTGTPLEGLWQPTHAPTHIV